MQRQTTISKPTLVVAGIALVATAVSFFVYKPSQNQQSSQDATTSASEQQAGTTAPAEQASAEDSELRPQSPSERAQASKPPPVTQPISRPVAATIAQAPASAGPEPSAYTRQLVSGLTNLDFSRGPITKEQAEQWKQRF